MAKKEFGEGPLYTIANYVFWFVLSNIYFLITNIVFVFLIVTPMESAQLSPAFFTLLFITAIPVGPSLTALLSTMGKIVREGDVSVTRDFFKAYKTNFKQSIGLWTLEITLIAVMLIDINFFSKTSYGSIFISVFYVLIAMVIIMGLYVFPIISRFYMRSIDVIKLSFYYSIKKFKITLLNIVAVVGGYFILMQFTSIAMLCLISIICFLIMFYERNIMKEMEERFTDTGENKKEEKNPDEWHIPEDELAGDIKLEEEEKK